MRFLLRTLGGLWSLLMILLTLASLALSVAMTLFPAVLGAVASGVEALSGRKTVVAEARARESRLLADLDAERAARRSETAALRRELAQQAVPYRGSRVAMREAVKSSPGAAWDSARGLYAELPEISISASYDWTLARLSGIWDWFGTEAGSGEDTEEGTPE